MSPEKAPDKWDHETDVLIIGGGTTGLPAGSIVAEAGLKATILEARPKCGGSLNMVVGSFCVAGTDEQKELGIEDTPDLWYEDIVSKCDSDPEITRAMVDNALDGYRMLQEEGVVWPGLVPHPGNSRNRNLGWLLGFGPKLVQASEKRCRRLGVEILFRHRAHRLITNPETGRVIGATVETKEGTKYFRARKAVIIAAGGFGQNKDLVAEFAPEMTTAVPLMPVSHQGDGLIMGMDVGASTKDMGVAVAGSWPVCAETHARAIWACDFGAIMVNVHGKRFHEESSADGYYGPMTKAGMQQPGNVYWVIFDDDIFNNVGRIEGTTERNMNHVKDIERCKKYSADALDELAEKTGIDADGLKKTIEKYNKDVEEVGYDTEFGRKGQHGEHRALVKIKPPYKAIKCTTCTTSMKGGLKINAKGEVLNHYGEAIPGLYAGGEVAGGLWKKSYMLGVMSSAAYTQGIIAARNAIKEPDA